MSVVSDDAPSVIEEAEDLVRHLELLPAVSSPAAIAASSTAIRHSAPSALRAISEASCASWLSRAHSRMPTSDDCRSRWEAHHHELSDEERTFVGLRPTLDTIDEALLAASRPLMKESASAASEVLRGALERHGVLLKLCQWPPPPRDLLGLAPRAVMGRCFVTWKGRDSGFGAYWGGTGALGDGVELDFAGDFVRAVLAGDVATLTAMRIIDGGVSRLVLPRAETHFKETRCELRFERLLAAIEVPQAQPTPRTSWILNPYFVEEPLDAR